MDNLKQLAFCHPPRYHLLMKITREFLLDSVIMNSEQAGDEVLLDIAGHTIDKETIGKNYAESINLTIRESRLGELQLPAANKLLGSFLGCEMASEPLTEESLKNPLVVIPFQINRSEYFNFAAKGISREKTVQHVVDLGTSGFTIENGVLLSDDAVKQTTLFMKLSLSAEEYKEIEMLGTDQIFKLTIKERKNG
jgi:hypothetical protein